MAERAAARAIFWQAWALVGVLGVSLSVLRLAWPTGSASTPSEERRRGPQRVAVSNSPLVESAPVVTVDQQLARLALAQTSNERCTMLGQLEPSEEAETTYAITTVLEKSQLLSVRACATEALAAQPTSAARSWLMDLAEDPQPEVHSRALEALAKSEDTSAYAVVVEATHSEDAAIRVSAVTALLEAQREGAVSAFVAVLPSVPDRATLSGLIDALGESHDARALPVLLQLVDEGDRDSHLQAISALGALGAPAAVARLDSLLAVGSQPEFDAAVSALKTLAPDSLLQKLKALLSSGNEQRQEFALSAIIAREEPGSADLMGELLSSGKPNQQRVILQRLASHPEPQLEARITQLAADSEPQLRRFALRALARIATPSARDSVRRLTGSDAEGWLLAGDEAKGTDDELRARRVAALWPLNRGSLRAFMALTRDPAPEAQAAALKYAREAPNSQWAIAQLAMRAPSATLFELAGQLPGMDVDTRGAVIRALAQRGEPQVSSILRGAKSDSDPDTRRAALRGLAEMGDATALADVQRLLQAPDATERTFALEVLSSGSLVPTAELERLALDSDPQVSSVALHSLQSAAPERVLGLAQRAVRAVSAEDRATLLSNLRDLNASVTRPLLEAALDDAGEDVRLFAVRSLSELQGPEAAQRLLAVASDPNRAQDERSEAAAGLLALGGPLVRSNRALLDSLNPFQEQESFQCSTNY